MPERPDLRQISGNIREALADCDRETLVDMLTFVFKEYVVEGPPPLLVSQSERIPDLEGLSFAQLIRSLQTRLDVPELSLFQVDGEQVSVRVQGVMTPLDTARARAAGMEPLAAAPPAQPPAPDMRAPGVRVVEAQLGRPAAPAAAAPQAAAPQAATPQAAGAQPAARERDTAGQGSAPSPRQGLSIRGRATGGAAAAPGAPAPRDPGAGQPAGQAGAQPAAASPSREAPASPSRTGDDDLASTRFSLLELD